MRVLKQFKDRVSSFAKGKDGAAMIEYTVLLGLILVLAIAAIVFAGTWVSSQWTALQTVLEGATGG